MHRRASGYLRMWCYPNGPRPVMTPSGLTAAGITIPRLSPTPRASFSRGEPTPMVFSRSGTPGSQAPSLPDRFLYSARQNRIEPDRNKPPTVDEEISSPNSAERR